MAITNKDEFNNSYNIREVLERVLGSSIQEKGGYITCPFCGSSKASITDKKNMFRCWSNNCTDGSARPYRFIDLYMREVEKLQGWEVKKRIDAIMGTSFYQPKKNKKTGEIIEETLYTKEYEVDKYCGDVGFDILNDLLTHKRLVVKAGTGMGKTTMLIRHMIDAYNSRIFTGDNNVDKIIFATARGSIVEEIGEQGFDTFFRDDVQLPYTPFVTTTTHKAPLLNQQLEEGVFQLGDGSWQVEDAKDYILIVDECHLLLTARDITVKKREDLRELRKLIERAKYVIFTSANTDDFFKACKDIYGIEQYIHIKRKTPLYNLEELLVKRIPSDRDARNQILLQDIIAENHIGNKVLLIHNNIQDLKKIEAELLAMEMSVKEVHSANKTDEDVIESYEALIKKSTLNCDVMLCTSVIDTGVNIKDKRVTTMLVQDQQGFDDVTVVQAFARVRVENNNNNGNRGILYLNSIKNREERHDQLHTIDKCLRDYEDKANAMATMFNRHMFDNHDYESYECYKDVWGLLKYNDLYADSRHLVAIECLEEGNESPTLQIDKVAIYDNARRHCLKANYFNDKFIKSVLRDVNTKEIKFSTVEMEIEKPNKDEMETFQDVILKFMEDDKDFFNATNARYVQKQKQTGEDEPWYIGIMRTEHKTPFTKLDKRIKSMCEMLHRMRVDLSRTQYINAMYEAHALLKGKELQKRIREIEFPIYNTMYDKCNIDEIMGIGDTHYIWIRKSFDKVYNNRYALTERAINTFADETVLREINKGMIDYDDTAILKRLHYYDKKDKLIKKRSNNKPVKMDKKMEEAVELIKLVYNISEKGFLTFKKSSDIL